MIRVSNIKMTYQQKAKAKVKVEGKRLYLLDLNLNLNLLTFCILIFAFFMIFAFCILNFNCYAESISSTELIQNAQQYDRKQVIYQGEVVGEVMARDSKYWANLWDGKNAIGIWMPPELARVIEFKGNYKTKGDVLEIEGIFNRACPQHGGDLDIHAVSGRKIESGRQLKEELMPAKKTILFILLGVLCLIIILRRLVVK